MSLRFLALLLCYGLAMGSSKYNTSKRISNHEDLLAQDTNNELISNRKGKLFFPSVKVVSFDNTPCLSSTGLIGTCYSKKECTALFGQSSGSCAKGYGVCCVVTATCDTKIITANNTYFQNPGFPSSYSTAGKCEIELYLPPGTVQVKLTFAVFDILGPVEGFCGNDTFSVSGFNTGKTIPILCGDNTHQHMYIDVDDDGMRLGRTARQLRGPYKLVFASTGVRYDRKWNILVSFLTDFDRCKAPPRCLQYYTDLSGSVSSFNHGSFNQQLINDLSYSICFGYHKDFCDIRILFSVLDMGTLVNGRCRGAQLDFSGGAECDTRLDLERTLNGRGPVVINVVSSPINAFEQVGFQATYMYLPC